MHYQNYARRDFSQGSDVSGCCLHTAMAAHQHQCYGWLAIVFDVNGVGVILNVNNE
jgi:hypothetical protein